MKSLIIRLVLVLVVGVLVYNYFWGNNEEKESSKKVFNQTKALFVSVKDLIKSEKTKFDQGKYDNAIEKVQDVYTDLKSKADKMDSESREKLNQLDEESHKIKNELNKTRNSGDNQMINEKEKIDGDMQDLLKKTEQLLKDINKE